MLVFNLVLALHLVEVMLGADHVGAGLERSLRPLIKLLSVFQYLSLHRA